MKSTKRKIITSIISIILCVIMAFGGVVSVGAAGSTADILVGLLGGTTGGSVNITQMFTNWLTGVINEEGPFDKIVENIKNEFNGTATDDDPEADEEEIAVIDKAEAGNIVELFNLTVNELKKGQPAFLKTETVGLPLEIQSTIASAFPAGLGAINGIIASVIGNKDLAASVVSGIEAESSVKTKYAAGNDVKNNISVSGKDYVSCLTAEDVKDYTITIYKSGAYKMHIDLIDAEGASSQSGLSHVFNTTDKATATLNILDNSLNVGIMFKYVNNYVECQVNRNGEITSYTQSSGITFMFQQKDGSYSTKMPYLGVDFQEEGMIYSTTTEFSNIDFSLRKMGDVNSDGKVNSTDARLTLRMASGIEECPDADRDYCDVTLDGRVTAADAREILRASAGVIDLPDSATALGLTEYKKDEATKKHVEDLLILIVAYQAAKDEKQQQQIEDYYNDKYNGTGSTETTTVAEETTTKINTTNDKVNEVIDIIGGLIGGFINK